MGSEVSQVRVSRRLAKTPAIVVAGQYGYSANLEKVMKSQAVSDQQQQMLHKMKERILEINPRHALVEELKKKVISSTTSILEQARFKGIFTRIRFWLRGHCHVDQKLDRTLLI